MPFLLTDAARLPSGAFGFGFNNTPQLTFMDGHSNEPMSLNTFSDLLERRSTKKFSSLCL